jgi:N,N-dimethyltransferase
MFGYLSSRALFSAIELGVFDALEERPATAEDLGKRLGLAARPARLLLLALLGEQIVNRDGEMYRNAPVASRYLVGTSPDSIVPLAAHQAAHFAKFSQLTQALQDNAPVRMEAQGDHPAFGGPERFAQITRTAATMMMAGGLAEHLASVGRQHLVDLGCGSCVYSIALAKANPDLRITAVDRPSLCQLAGSEIASAGLGDRINVRPSDIFVDSFTGADIALLSNVAEGYDPARAQALIRHVYEWLPVGGELLIHSHMWEHARTPFPYTVGLILVVNNAQGGEPYGEVVTREWLTDTGFTTVDPAVAVSPISAVIRAVK